MFCFPGSSSSDAWETIELMHKLEPDYSINHYCHPYPGTRLNTMICKKYGKDVQYLILNKMKNVYSKFDYPGVDVTEKKILCLSYMLIRYKYTYKFTKAVIKLIPMFLCEGLSKIFTAFEYQKRCRLPWKRFVLEALHNYDYI